MLQLTHPNVKTVGQIWNTQGINNLSDLRQSIIDASDKWAKGFSIKEQQEQKDWFKGACFEVWGEYFINVFGTNPKVGIINYSPIPKVEDRGVDGWGVDLSENKKSTTAQFKFRSDPTNLITYEEIAKFRDQSREDYNVLKSEQMVVITTAYDFNDIAKGQARGMRLLGWDQLNDLINGVPNPQHWNAKFWQDFNNILTNSSQKPKRSFKKPFPHQEIMFEAMRSFMSSEEQKRGYVLCGTGGGKTLAMSMIAEWYLLHEGRQVIVIAAPRIQLVNQIAKEFYDQQKAPFESLTFHSGSPAETEKYEDPHSLASVDATSQEYEMERIRQMGGFSTTDERFAANWLRNTTSDAIIFTTYHSSAKLLQRLIEEQIEVVYFGDECHNLVTPHFSAILNFDIFKFIGFTATEEETEDPNDIGMNNYTLWGKRIIEIKPAHLVNLGITVPPKVYTAHIDSGTGSIEEVTTESTGQIVRKFKDEVCPTADCRIIVNCESCAIAHHLAESEVLRRYLPEFERLVVTSYRDLMGARNRDKELKKFATATNAIIFHYDMLGEGIDVPGVTAIMSWRELGIRDNIQLIGRASRIVKVDRENLDKGIIKIKQEQGWVKPYAYILCPLVKGNEDSQNVYKNMIRIIARLREGDRPISQYLHGADSTGRLQPSAFPNDKEFDDKKPNQLTIETEQKESVDKIYTGDSKEDILKMIEASLQKSEAAEKREIKIKGIKIAGQMVTGANLSKEARDLLRRKFMNKE